jgi:hypothetical protein
VDFVVDGPGTRWRPYCPAPIRHDGKLLEATVDAIPPVHNGKPGRPLCRQALRQRGITSRITRREIESNERLGCYRWVVERTLSWLYRYRWLRLRYEQRNDIHQPFLSLGCALICLTQIQRFC